MTDDPYTTFEAFTPGSSLPSAAVPQMVNGKIVFPFNVGSNAFSAIETSINRGFAPSAITGAPPASNGKTPIAATIVRPTRALGESVVGTVFGATGIGQIAKLVRELPAIERRPLFPPGLVDAIPQGIRNRVVVWDRVIARIRSSRATMGSRVSRE